MVKRVIIFLLVTVGIFTTVEFINFKIEDANNWGVRDMDTASRTDSTVGQTASAKTYNAHQHKEIKTPAIPS